MLENPMVRECLPLKVEPPLSYHPPIKCACECGREIVDGWEWEGDYFYSNDCVIRYMQDNGILKAVEL